MPFVAVAAAVVTALQHLSSDDCKTASTTTTNGNSTTTTTRAVYFKMEKGMARMLRDDWSTVVAIIFAIFRLARLAVEVVIAINRLSSDDCTSVSQVSGGVATMATKCE